MNSQLETILDEAENRYLKPEELNLLSQYVESLPERLEAYRAIREKEIDLMQKVADQLQAEMPQEPVENLERCIKNTILVLRQCSMSMLLNDPDLIRLRLMGWLKQIAEAYQTSHIDSALYRLLEQQLQQQLSPKHLDLLTPLLTLAKNELSSHDSPSLSSLGW